MEASVFQLLAGSNAKAAGLWQRELLGLVSFVARSALCRGAISQDNAVFHSGWRLNAEDSPAHCEEALSGLRSSSFGVHLFPWCLDIWSIRCFGTQVEIPLALLIDEHVRFALAPPGPISPSSDEGASQTPAQPGEPSGNCCFDKGRISDPFPRSS